MIERVNVKGKRIYFNYNNDGELVELILMDKSDEDIDVSDSWLND